VVKPQEKRNLIEFLHKEKQLSIRKSCRLINLSRKSFKYKSLKNDAELVEKIKDLANKKKKYGYRRIYAVLKRNGENVNHKKVYRLYKKEGLQVRKPKRKKIKTMKRENILIPTHPNHLWAMDFMNDTLACGRKIRTLNVLDIFTRKCLAIEVDTSLPSLRVTRVLDELIKIYGRPAVIRVDNGSEFTSRLFDNWVYQNKIEIDFIQPGKPNQNGFIESFNDKFRSECLNEHWFLTLKEARELIEEFRVDYNDFRPHSSLNDLTPNEFLDKFNKENTNSALAA
jgi:putative transposase